MLSGQHFFVVLRINAYKLNTIDLNQSIIGWHIYIIKMDM